MIMSKITIDHTDYDLSEISVRARDLLESARSVDTKIKETKNMLAILTKAKRAYISDLKIEMLTAKAGLDFND